jgi:hypothetical protein
MSAAVAPVRPVPAPLPLPLPPGPRVRLRARPIPVAAYPAGTPRWVTYGGRRQRVVAVHEQPPLDPRLEPLPAGARRLQVELSSGTVLTLIHDRGAWYRPAEGTGPR